MTPLFAMMSGSTLLIILVVALLLFGVKRLPEISRNLARGFVEFKKGMKGMEDEVDVSSPPVRPEPAALEAPRPVQRPAAPAPAPKFEDNAGTIQTPPRG
jgi:sec-independent protein translocase protein TatA